MERVMLWRAEDGAQFEKQEDCRNYEIEIFLNKYADVSVEFFDDTGEKMNLRKLIKDYFDDITLVDDSVNYIVVRKGSRNRVLEFIQELYDNYFSESYCPLCELNSAEIEDIQEKTILKYDEYNNVWTNLTFRVRIDLETVGMLLH